MQNNQYHKVNLENCSFLITGGAGFIGSNLVEYLIRNNAGQVRVLDNLSTGIYKNIEAFVNHSNFEFINGDIRNLEICQSAAHGIDYVLHQAALGSVPRSISDPMVTNEVNISGFLNMLVAARDNKVKRFVYAASSSTYGDSTNLPKTEDKIGRPLSPYAVTKYVNELYAEVFSKIYNFHSIGLRYFNVFGPNQDPNGPYAAVIPLFMKAASSDDPPTINGDGCQTRDFTYVENVIQANIKALFGLEDLSASEVMNVACGERTSLLELWEIISLLFNCKNGVQFGKSRLGDVKDSLASIEKAKRLIGYEPTVTIQEGLKRTYEQFT
jgi:UDP-N-acetylglucosamine 4-epimerase